MIRNLINFNGIIFFWRIFLCKRLVLYLEKEVLVDFIYLGILYFVLILIYKFLFWDILDFKII